MSELQRSVESRKSLWSLKVTQSVETIAGKSALVVRGLPPLATAQQTR
jgi:hypothetical protein